MFGEQRGEAERHGSFIIFGLGEAQRYAVDLYPAGSWTKIGL